MRRFIQKAAALIIGGVMASACGSSSVFEMSVGDCFQDAGEGELSSVETVDCAEPHDNEVYAVLDLPDTVSVADIEAQADALCQGDPFTEYVGVEWLESEFSYTTIHPTLASWNDGDREVVCSLYRDDNQPMVGVQRGAGLAAAEQTPEPPAVPESDAPTAVAEAPAAGAPAAAPAGTSLWGLEVGDCFNDGEVPAEIGPVPTVDCAQPHDNEVYALVGLADGPFPGDVASEAEALCDGDAFTQFVGVPWLESNFSALSILPTQASWEAGDRTAVCYLWSDDLEPMTGSQRGVGAG